MNSFRLRRNLTTVIVLSSVAALATTLAACSSDTEGTSGSGSSQEAVGPAVRGTVTSAAGAPVEGVKVTAGSQSATTNAAGQYTLRAPAGQAVLRFSKTGFVDGLERLEVGASRATQLDAILLPRATPVPIDATAGGEVTTTRGAKVVVPPSALVDKNGAPVTGSVNVILTPIDPSRDEEVRAAPGEFLANQANQPTMIESYGMVDITIEKDNEKVQVAPGKELELRIPAPATGTPLETTVLWSFDEAKGVWVDEGTATYDPATRTYVAKAKHMSFWNADQPYTATCVCGIVYDKQTNQPLTGSRVVARGTSYFGTSEGSTGDDGKFCLAVRKDSDVSVAAYHKSGGGQARDIKSGSADTAVPVVKGSAVCADIGRWDVEKDVFIDSQGGTSSCAEASNAFANTCANPFWLAFSQCYMPSGECVMKQNANGTYGISYANGARMESDTNGQSIKYYGPGDTLCATGQSSASPTGDSTTMTLTLPNGESVVQEVNANGDIVFRCSNGQTTVITAEQQQKLDACTSGDQSGGGGQGSQCRIEGVDGGVGGNGGIGSPCTDDSACTGGNVCCDVSGTKFCYGKTECDAIRNSGN